jgi:hypothetical protein
MTTFKKDNTKVKQASFGSGPITRTDFYSCTITKAYDKKSQVPGSESAAIHFDVTTDKGQYASFDLWWRGKNGLSEDKNGKDLPALQSINDLQVLLELEELTSKPGRVAIYDFDLRQDVETKKMVYPDLVGRQIGIIFEIKEQPKNVLKNGEWVASGETKLVAEFRQFFDADTKESAGELISHGEPVACDRFMSYLLEDEHIVKQASNQPSAPTTDLNTSKVGLVDNFDSDIPF